MLVDLALNSFDAAVPDMVDAARAAETAGYDAVWVTDHFSGAVVGADVTRDPFVCLGAIGVATERIDIGVLVANVVNRHPAQLASAVDSLASLAPGRVRLGVGSGAAPGSRFAVEHESIGRPLDDAPTRRHRLVESIGALRAIWRGEQDFGAPGAPEVGFHGLTAVVDGAMPPIIVGASAWPTIDVALAHSDGVNIRATSSLHDQLRRLADVRPPGFEVSVLAAAGDASIDRAALAADGCDRLILGISTPFDVPSRDVG